MRACEGEREIAFYVCMVLCRYPSAHHAAKGSASPMHGTTRAPAAWKHAMSLAPICGGGRKSLKPSFAPLKIFVIILLKGAYISKAGGNATRKERTEEIWGRNYKEKMRENGNRRDRKERKRKKERKREASFTFASFPSRASGQRWSLSCRLGSHSQRRHVAESLRHGNDPPDF